MQELWLLHDALTMLLISATTAALPPISTGAFWTIVAFYGVVSIIFDDETPRGVPGIDYFYATRPHLKDPQS
jgi:hypothetical protein